MATPTSSTAPAAVTPPAASTDDDQPPAARGASLAARLRACSERVRSSRAARTVLVVMLATDALFVAVHLAHSYLGTPGDREFGIDVDRGFAETFGYLKLLWAGGGLVLLARRVRELLPLVLGAGVGVLLLDDALQLHERTGRALESDLGGLAVLGLRGIDVGEIVFAAVAGLLVVAAVGLAWRAAGTTSRTVGVGVGAAVGLMLFAGLGIDMVHVEGSFEPVWKVLEDGTELVACTLLLAHVVAWLDPRDWRRTTTRTGSPGG